MSTTLTAVAKSGREQVWAFFTDEADAYAWCEAQAANGYDCTISTEAVAK
jgi:hypothetical protein